MPAAFTVMNSMTVAPALRAISNDGSHGRSEAYLLTTVSVCASAKMDSSSTTANEWRRFIVEDKVLLIVPRGVVGTLGR
jgi:hypothetical protein